MKRIVLAGIFVGLLLSGQPLELRATKTVITQDRIQLLREIQDKLNLSFQCDFSVFVGETRKYATANSSGIIIVDKSFLQTADKDRIFFAIAHEYAHAYLEHDARLFQSFSESRRASLTAKDLVEVRRRFEKEADGIAARKAKQMGFSIESTIGFILSNADPERGIPPELRVYYKPRDRADYILAVYQSS